MPKKTTKEFFEVYRPKAKGEQRFVDKHITIKHKDANGNGDDVFKAKNVKGVDRSPDHGYNPGEDADVYESLHRNKGNLMSDKDVKEDVVTEGVEVKKTAIKGGHVITVHDGNSQSFPLHPEHQNKIRALQKGEKTSFKDETGSNVSAERTGSLVHLNRGTDAGNRKVAVGYHHFKEGLEEIAEGIRAYYEELGEEIETDDLLEFADEIYESLFEEVEELEEISQSTLNSYSKKVQKKIDYHNKAAEKHSIRSDEDDIDGDDDGYFYNRSKSNQHQSKARQRQSMQSLAKAKQSEKAAKSHRKDARSNNWSRLKIKEDIKTKEDVINSFIDRYVTEDVNTSAISLEDQLIAKLEEYLPESHINSFVDLFRELNEDNQFQMIEHIIDEDSVNDIMNFIISEKNSEDEA